MAMSNLYSKIAPKPVKRFQDSISVSQTNAWVNESPNNGGLSLSPPHSISQRETMQITQPASAPTSPLASPNLTNTSFNLTCPGQLTVDPNWQASKPTVRERNAAMFNNELMADIRFVVGSPGHTQSIPAHKYVLATGSSVFYAIYLYCDEIQLEADTVLATLYVAKKYIVPHLARACVNYLETSLTAKNACLLLSQSRLFEEPELMQRCWEVIDAQVRLSHSLSTLELESASDYHVVHTQCNETESIIS
ncbi:BTB/POZ domain-containing protein 3 [Blattella germanica]|nr:BTB/POZ domain-containing protein 3 [Blattella germanica]